MTFFAKSATNILICMLLGPFFFFRDFWIAVFVHWGLPIESGCGSYLAVFVHDLTQKPQTQELVRTWRPKGRMGLECAFQLVEARGHICGEGVSNGVCVDSWEVVRQEDGGVNSPQTTVYTVNNGQAVNFRAPRKSLSGNDVSTGRIGPAVTSQ